MDEESIKRLREKVEQMRKRDMEEPREWPIKERVAASFDVDGLRCVVQRGDMFMTGYVRVPSDHPDAKKWYDDVGAEVHGGLTFRCLDTEGYTWFGFDTGHCGDMMILPDIPGLPMGTGGRIWTLDDMKAEVSQLAHQLATRLVKNKV